MDFPPYWAKGTHDGFYCWRWSHRSFEEALAIANQAAQKLADRFRAGDILERGYGYPERPFREPVLREIKNRTGNLAAVITRNSYGSLVLNTARVMFVDVDLPQPKRSGGFFRKLFGKPEIGPAPDPAADVIKKAETWAHDNRSWGWRIYRTRAGLRLMTTHALFEPDADVTNAVFETLGADLLYRKLCRRQKCFRARLTPKPWRCGIEKPPTRWPFPDTKREKQFNKWQAKYEQSCSEWATCHLIRTLSSRDVHPDVQLVLSLHDELTRAGTTLPLA